MLTGDSLGWHLPLGGRVLVRVPESKRALRWEESKISGAAAGRCGFRRPKEPELGRNARK